MEIEELIELISDPQKLVTQIKVIAPEISEAALKLEPEDHQVCDDAVRKKNEVEVPSSLFRLSYTIFQMFDNRRANDLPISFYWVRYKPTGRVC